MIALRSYRPSDLDAMHALDVACFEKPFRFTRTAMRRFAESANARLILAEENTALVGFVILHVEATDVAPIGYIVTLDVSKDHRRKGVAGQLMREAERAALREQCAAIVLHVFIGNQSAIQFYKSQNFTHSHREPNFYGPKLDAWVLHKPLHPRRE